MTACSNRALRCTTWPTPYDTIAAGATLARSQEDTFVNRTFALFTDLHGIPRGKLFDTRTRPVSLNACCGVLTKDLFGEPVLFERHARPVGGADLHSDASAGTVFPVSGGGATPAALGATAFCIVPLIEASGDPHPLDARSRLASTLATRRTADTFLVGAELEFFLSPSPTMPLALDGQAYACGGLATREGYLQAVLDALDSVGIDWTALSQENEIDQYEIALAPTSALVQADRIVLARLLCRALAPRFGLNCTFAPLVSLQRSPSHLHLHLSSPAHPVGTPASPGAAVSRVLARANELLSVLCPSALSRRGIEVGSFASADLDVGEDDRFRAIRLLGSAESRRFEVRLPSAESNPYLVLLGLIGAATTETVPHEPGSAVAGKLDWNPTASLDVFCASDWCRSLFGEPIVTRWGELKRREFERWNGQDIAAEVAALRRVA